MVKNIRKKLLKTILLIAIIVMIIIPKQEIAASEILLGDINGDKIVDSRDMLYILRHIATKVNKKHPEWELKEEKLEAADVTKDEKVDAEDMLLVLRYIAASNSETIKNKHPEWIEFKKKETVKDTKEQETKEEEKTKPEQEQEEIKQETKQEKEETKQETKKEQDTKKEETKKQEEQTTKPETKTIEVTGIKIDKTKLEIEEGKTEKIIATIEPTNATNKEIKYSSSNTNIATVDDNGNIKGIKAGTAVITVKSKDEKVTATCEVTVKTKIIEVEKIEINKKSIELDMSGTKTVTLKTTVTPNTATDKTITWSSSNTKVATVDKKSGKVTAKKNGTATITANSNNGKKATCKITVKTSPTSVKLNKTTLSLNLAKTKTATLKATILPSTASNKSVIYSSSNTKVAVVDKKTGKVTAKANGKAIITVKTTNNNKSAKCTVTVSGGYWEVKNGKYKYYYLNGTSKTWTVSEYEGWKKLKEKNVKSMDPKAYKIKGNRIIYAGFSQYYRCKDNTANKIAEKNGGSLYAITVDIDRKHETIFENHNGLWEPIKSTWVRVGGQINYYVKGGKCSDNLVHTKNCLTPEGLFYTNGAHWPTAGENPATPYWVAFGVKGRGDNVDYLHGSMYPRSCGTGGCVAAPNEHAKWIYYNCGRGTPVLIW